MLSSLIDELRGQGDSLADEALADYQRACSETQSLLEQGMRHGLASSGSMPDSFRQLLEDSETAADTISAEEVDLAMQPYTWVGPMWLSIALGPESLVHTYSDPG